MNSTQEKLYPCPKKELVRILLILEANHRGCREEAIAELRKLLGLNFDQNTLRHSINLINETDIDNALEALESEKG